MYRCVTMLRRFHPSQFTSTFLVSRHFIGSAHATFKPVKNIFFSVSLPTGAKPWLPYNDVTQKNHDGLKEEYIKRPHRGLYEITEKGRQLHII